MASGLSWRRRERQRDAEGLQDSERFAELAGFLALFEIDDEAQSRARCQSQILLGDAEALAGVPDQCADRNRCVFQGSFHGSYRTGILCAL